ncbi:MAG: 4-alpha-glucanotransferase, partial [Ruminococcus sp.]|nr:4-alpha-glucanotransferase [Ruminococcus sp.]
PGMKVLEFAFDSGEENDYLPHNYTNNCVVYTGTHDNDTVMGWLETPSTANGSRVRASSSSARWKRSAASLRSSRRTWAH